ncbi:MAG TPA: PKD domain-containing protein, partial [Puia sp.]|nr:PKD domain-containing protein [Puia sp.]
SDNFTLSSVSPGTYSMYLIVRDPTNYKKPLPLAVNGRNSDGGYLLRSNVTVGTGTANQSPTADAGTDKTVQLPTSTAALAGTGKDADGTVASYAWTKVSGPAGGALSSPTTANTNVSGMVAGVYVYSLTVTDNQGATGTAKVQITVNAAATANQSPVAKAGSDISISLPTNQVTLDGSASSDPDGSIASYAWAKISGPAQFSISNNSSASTSVKNLAAGIYSFQLKVTDNGGATALDTVVVTVTAAPPQNQPPVANAGSNITVTLPTNVANLNGSASKDPDGTISTYTWSQTSGPSAASIASASTASTGISGLVQGSYNFMLKVTDNSGATDTDTVIITVNAAGNKPPVANAGNSRSITLPTNSTTLDGSLSSDPDGTIASYTWSQIGGPSIATITNGALATVTAGNLVAGRYTFELTVTDNKGAQAKAQVKISVLSSGVQPPIANAGVNQTITLPINSVVIDGSGSVASSGNIAGYTWTESSGPSAVALTNTAQNTLGNLQAGVYVFYLTVTDNLAAKGTDSVIITVNGEANMTPVADAGAGVSIVLPVNTATLDGSKSSDPDGTIVNYGWSQVSGPNTAVITSGAGTDILTLSGLIAGNYTYQLKVTDNSGASSTAQVKIRVADVPNQSPTANAGVDQTITAPANTVNLDGSGSYDPDGSISSYSWAKVSGPGTITISNSNTATPSVIGLQAGSYVFELIVSDNKGATANDQVTITVNPKPGQPNQLPVANAGNNLTITLPVSSINLNAGSSFDPDGTITAYGWKQLSGPSTAMITGGSIAAPTVSQLYTVGQYAFELTVTDNNGATSQDQVTVTVNPTVAKANQAPVADAGSGDTLNLPVSNYILDATHSTDPDGTISSYQWQELSGPNMVTSSPMNESKVNISGFQPGDYEFQVMVTDNLGASSTATTKVTVMQGSVLFDRLVIYPNPAHDVVNGRIISSVMGTVRVSIYDMNGRQVLTDQIEKSGDEVDKTFNISQLASGMYMIHINIGNRKTMIKKFIKN